MTVTDLRYRRDRILEWRDAQQARVKRLNKRIHEETRILDQMEAEIRAIDDELADNFEEMPFE